MYSNRKRAFRDDISTCPFFQGHRTNPHDDGITQHEQRAHLAHQKYRNLQERFQHTARLLLTLN
jgi:hypothetical protein